VTGSSFEDFIDCQDLTLSRLSLELATKVVPKLRLGDNFISCEETDGIDLGVGFLFSGQFAAEDEVLSDLKTKK
jgi:hypothetical protein